MLTSCILGRMNIVLNNDDRNYDDSRQWCKDKNMQMIMIKTQSDYDEVKNTLTVDSDIRYVSRKTSGVPNKNQRYIDNHKRLNLCSGIIV